MILILFSTLASAMSCQLHGSLGRASALSAREGMYHGVGSESGSEDVLTVIRFTAIAKWLNPDQPIQSGRCRANLAPT